MSKMATTKQLGELRAAYIKARCDRCIIRRDCINRGRLIECDVGDKENQKILDV